MNNHLLDVDSVGCTRLIFVARSGQGTRLGMTLPQSVMTQTRGGRLPAQRAGQHHPGLTHHEAVTRGGLMNFDLDLNSMAANL